MPRGLQDARCLDGEREVRYATGAARQVARQGAGNVTPHASLAWMVSATVLCGCGSMPGVRIASTGAAGMGAEAEAEQPARRPGQTSALRENVTASNAPPSSPSPVDELEEPPQAPADFPCTRSNARLPCSMDPICTPSTGRTVREKECGLIFPVNWDSVRQNLYSSCQLRNLGVLMAQSQQRNETSFYGAAIVTPGLDVAIETRLRASAAVVRATLELADRIDSGDEAGARSARKTLLRAMLDEQSASAAFGAMCDHGVVPATGQ